MRMLREPLLRLIMYNILWFDVLFCVGGVVWAVPSKCRLAELQSRMRTQ